SQVYDGWRVLTARPTVEDMAAATHRLYGHVDPAVVYSVGDWLRAVAPVLRDAEEAGLRPIFVGGTGLYFHALTEGLAEIPATPPEVRASIEVRLGDEGLAALAQELSRSDPVTAATADLANPRRVARALEVLATTGRGLADWRAETPPPLLPDYETALIAPERAALYARCDARFDIMLAEGALDEARAMAARALDPVLPAMKAVGAPELFAHLAGEISLEQAATAARRATRNYAKRQMTWMRSRMRNWRVVNPSAISTT
ncbi:MAG: tRNA (adenosine(37)-N6)-dimethylallyltransferase MiaA, partial [Pseudomonadota bacterium]